MLGAPGGVGLSSQALAMLRAQVADLILGSVFLFIGLTACAIAGIRRRSGTRIFAWLGIWSALYGAVQLSQSQVVVAVSPRWLQISAPYANPVMTYLLVFPCALSFRELSLGKMRFLLNVVVFAELAIAVVGSAFFFMTGSDARLMFYNQLLIACMLVVLTTVVAVPRLCSKYLVLSDRGVLATGTLVFTVEALYNSLSGPVGYKTPRILDHFGFAILLFSFGYVALRLVFANEHRLLTIENELAIARDIQRSILPSSVPKLNHIRLSAAYLPMTAVAGDFYEFIPVDQNRIGILVADVSGHGVPAALIASMLKVAVQTLAACASEPGAMLRGLNRVLSGQLHGQLISAAYLWLDTEACRALYSAAGHPPLLYWRQAKLERIESNGIVFGVMPEYDKYPVCTVPITPGDRFLLYTDGATEPENANGDSFGEKRLEEVVRSNQSCPPSELSDRLLSEIRQWQPASMSQQDDITLIVIDLV
jgi:sigma-B regulation protein RsbU (phosphoserine phosphatase)